MSKASTPRVLITALALVVLLCSLPAAPARAQRREHLTPEEIELVRDAQRLDLRTDVFIKAAERRILAASDPASKSPEKDKEKWGEVKGTRRQLLEDVLKILDEAVVNIDDAHLRDPKSLLLGKSLARLAGAASRFLPQLAPMRESAQSLGEREAVEDVIAQAEEIIGAAKKHGVEENAEKEKTGKKGAKEN